MDYNKYTARELNDMAKTFSSIRSEVEANSNLFRIVYDDEAEIHIEYLSFTTEFYFKISNPRLEKNYVYYDLNYRPGDQANNSIRGTKNTSSDGRLMSELKNWMNLVKNIHDVKKRIHPSSKNLNHYKEKLFESFSFMEDENDDKPLEPQKQVELSNFLNLLIENFEDDPDIDDEIIQELKLLNENIPALTQLQIKNQISWTFAKIMFKGIDVLNKVTKVGTDAGIGFLFIEGIKTYIA
ncbi:hypothetical protein [Salinimicrobium gaetbulicola]|uniref:Uncharacterized protein n=1 Tax=Salinimicrobium gaetbulicola TaxID=999702 RepID=A0ABW3IBE2_9FLAO